MKNAVHFVLKALLVLKIFKWGFKIHDVKQKEFWQCVKKLFFGPKKDNRNV